MEAHRPVAIVVAVMLPLASLAALAPAAGAAHAPDATPPEPHRTTAHPAYGLPTVNDPTCADGDDDWTPPDLAPLPDELGSLSLAASPAPDVATGGMAVFGGLAILAGQGDGNLVYDITDPANPDPLATYGEEDTRDVQTLAFPDCRLYAVQAGEFPDRIEVWDLTDPTDPTKVSQLEPDGTHNAGIVPGTPILYNANSGGGGVAAGPLPPTGETEIYDLSDPSDPEQIRVWENGYGCHDITFHIDPAEGFHRAYCAGIEATQIWDLADPTDPEVVATIPFPHGEEELPPTAASPAAFSHLAMVSDDGETLIVGDETGGGLAPGCDVHAETEDLSLTGPAGNLYFYDVSDESDAELEGAFSTNSSYVDPLHGNRVEVVQECTAHFGRVVGTRDVAAVAFCETGIALVDFSDPSTPRLIDQYRSSASYWDAWSYRGTVYGSDRDGGLDVLDLGPG